MPPSSHPLTVAISAATSATGRNQKIPPSMRKKIRCRPDDAKLGYAYTVMTIDAVMAKKPPNPSIFAACLPDAAGAVFSSLIFLTPFLIELSSVFGFENNHRMKLCQREMEESSSLPFPDILSFMVRILPHTDCITKNFKNKLTDRNNYCLEELILWKTRYPQVKRLIPRKREGVFARIRPFLFQIVNKIILSAGQNCRICG